ncbi:MAG: hypothetical protein M3Z08_23290, partial [Chloroflexota bacterium]|nr:hypothetical protein [Chloroflexota bacterium]
MTAGFLRQQPALSKRAIVCVIAGDDAAPEVMRPTVEVLRLLAPDVRFVEALSGGEALNRYG